LRPKATEEEFIRAYRELQSTVLVAQRFGMSTVRTNKRKRFLEQKHGIVLPINDPRSAYSKSALPQKEIAKLEIQDGQVLIGSDIHIWPNHRTTMQRAFIQFARALKPAAIILNGDVADMASVSRHPSIGWEKVPTIQEEIEAIGNWLNELMNASKNSKRIWAAGNHDLRFESRIANTLPQARGVQGVHLKDHFPGWQPCWRVDINDDIVVRHREYGGEHAAYTNTLRAGKTIVTGHDHRIGVTEYADYNGIRYGVRCGMLADSPLDAQFVNYLEARAPNWHSGFVLLSFVGGKLLRPEICRKWDDEHCEWRGGLVRVV
jgi:predicted phosphodiesterase